MPALPAQCARMRRTSKRSTDKGLDLAARHVFGAGGAAGVPRRNRGASSKLTQDQRLTSSIQARSCCTAACRLPAHPHPRHLSPSHHSTTASGERRGLMSPTLFFCRGQGVLPGHGVQNKKHPTQPTASSLLPALQFPRAKTLGPEPEARVGKRALAPGGTRVALAGPGGAAAAGCPCFGGTR
jgi:hypothetical protein